MGRMYNIEINFYVKMNGYDLSKLFSKDNADVFFEDDRANILMYHTHIKSKDDGYLISIDAQIQNILDTLKKFLKMLEPFIVSIGKIGVIEDDDFIDFVYVIDGKVIFELV